MTLARAHRGIGTTLAAQGDRAGALESQQTALAIVDRLAHDGTDMRRDIAKLHAEIAACCRR